MGDQPKDKEKRFQIILITIPALGVCRDASVDGCTESGEAANDWKMTLDWVASDLPRHRGLYERLYPVVKVIAV